VKREYRVVFVVGGPGSGKGTQCSMLLNDMKDTVVHLSAGELLRELIRSGSEAGEVVKGITSRGHIVPSYITVFLMVQAMLNHPAGTRFLIDGYPRNLDNRVTWEGMGLTCDAVVMLDCPEDVMRQRLLNRNEGRADDRNEEVILERIRVFLDESKPQAEHYAVEGKLRKVSATGTVEEVYEEFKRACAV